MTTIDEREDYQGDARDYAHKRSLRTDAATSHNGRYGQSGACISPCGQYRYTLTRPALHQFPGKGTALFVMLNPSTADASIDDPTIRRCRNFARDWDCNGIVVANLYALRSTDPKALLSHPDPVGPDNDYWLASLASEFETIVCAWGANAKPDRVAAVWKIFQSYGDQRLRNVLCLGATKAGAPKHPLYVRGDQPLIRWQPAYQARAAVVTGAVKSVEWVACDAQLPPQGVARLVAI